MLSGFHEHNFYLYDKQTDIDQFGRLQSDIVLNIADLKKRAFKAHIKVADQLDNLIQICNSTSSSADSLKLLYLKRGFINDGLEGVMRKYAHWIEDSGAVSKYDILQLRRHEKDFINRNQLEYAALFFLQIDSLRHRIPVKTPTYQALINYRNSFRQLVSITEKLGVDNTKGVVPQTLQNIDSFNKAFNQTYSIIENDIYGLENNFSSFLIWAAVIMLLFIILLSFLFSKYLTRDIRLLNQRMASFIHSDFADVPPVPDDNGIMPNSVEIQNLYNDFNLLKVSLRAYISHLNERTSELQHLNEILGLQSDELKKQSEQLNILNKKLEKRASELAASNRSLEEFAFVTSHDLQEPLRMVSSFMILLKNKYYDQLDDKAKKYIDFAVDGSNRMQSMIKGLLEYSTIDNKESIFKPVDLNEIVQEAIQLNQFNIEETQAIIDVDNLPSILGIRSTLIQLFQNLLSNSIKYHRENVRPEIHIHCTDKVSHFQFIVKDNGIGIDQKYTKKIFSLFQRLHNKNEYSGTGLGLSICKKIVENHNGKIWVESTPSEGSNFYFTLSKEPIIGN